MANSDSEFGSLAELLPDLVREWLERSGSMPLTIFFNEYTAAFEDDSDDDTMEVAIGLIIEILNSHSRKWQILKLMATADTFGRFSGSIRPNQLVGLGLQLACQSPQPPNFMMESELTPTHLALDFPLSNICWVNITHLTLSYISTDECIDVLRRAPSLEYYEIFIYRPCQVSFRSPSFMPDSVRSNCQHVMILKISWEQSTFHLSKNGHTIFMVNTSPWQPCCPFLSDQVATSKFYTSHTSPMTRRVSTLYFKPYLHSNTSGYPSPMDLKSKL